MSTSCRASGTECAVGAWTEIEMAAGIEANGYMTGGANNTSGLCALEGEQCERDLIEH